MKRGQIGLELISAISIIMIVLGILSVIAYNKEITVDDINNRWKKKAECNELASIITGVYSSGHGTTWNYTPKETMFVYSDGIIEVPGEGNVEERPVNVAYYRCHKNESKLSPFLTEYNAVQYLAEKCEKPDDPFLTELIENIHDYDIIFLEDPHMHDNFYPAIIEWVENGGKLIISEHIGKKVDFCGMEYTNKGSGGHDATVLIDAPEFNLYEGEIIEFREYPHIDGKTLTVIAEYSKGFAGIVKWGCGEGEINYFSDFEAEFEGQEEKSLPESATSFIESAKYTILLGSVSCNYYGVSVDGVIDGNVEITNINGQVVIK